TARRERGVRDERRRAGRAVDEREPFLLTPRRRVDQRAEQVGECEDLARAAITPPRHRGERIAVEERSDRLREAAAHSRVAVEEVREPREHDSAYDTRRQRISERRRPQRRRRCLALTLRSI